MHSSSSRPFLAAEKVLRASRYGRHLVESRSCLWDPEALAKPMQREDMRAMLGGEAPQDDAALARQLRKLRQAAMLRIIARDLGGRANLQEVMGTATALAEETVRAALLFHETALHAQFGKPLAGSGAVQRLHVIGMGKLGGAELNVSSDIDLVLAYPEDGETDGPRKISNHEFFTRLARRLIPALAEITEDGFVFRVDTRLRPNGESGPLVASFDMLEEYFYSQGREWERYAWVKARVITGDRESDLMALVMPFVYRRHSDFSALESLRALHTQVRQEVLRKDIADNIKLGPGGIREIEFLVQVFQLIRGGRESALRVRPTLAALDQLGSRRLLPQEAVEQLRNAYVFLRNLEHRLQYLDDQQTQSLPQDTEDRLLIAQAMDFASYGEFEKALAGHREIVSRHFEAIFAGNGGAGQPDNENGLQLADPALAASYLGERGFRDPEKAVTRLVGLRTGARYQRMSASGQGRLERLLPLLVEAASGAGPADETLARLLQVIESIGRRESYLALLLEYPQALAALARLAAASAWAAEYLARQPMLLDELISAPGTTAPDWPKLKTELRAALDEHAGNIERQMDTLRHFKHAQTMRLLVQDLGGELPLETLSDHLSDLAFTVLEEVLRQAWAGLRTRHREQPKFAVVAYGKLGGKELGYASDLDLIFLYDDVHEAAQEVYARLAQRINTWLTSVTPAGVLYETDLRLRPNGAAGLLVSSLAAFEDYQRSQAWVWEHQALTRARYVAGDRELGTRFEAVREAVLRMPRDRAQLKQDVAQMRQKMREGHPNRSPLFDLKHDAGGIVDVEFVVQYLVLGYSHPHPELTGNLGNLALLARAAQLGLIPSPLAEGARAAYREFRLRQHALRLQGERYARLPPDDVARHAKSVVELWNWVFEGDRV